MSCVLIIATVAVGGWPTFCAAASVAAASLGFKLLKNKSISPIKEIEQEKVVELNIENSQVLTDSIRPDEELIFGKGNLKIHIYKDPRGECALHVSGKGKTDKELEEEGTKLINKIKQQYVYQKVTQELKKKGFSINQEELTKEGKIKISLKKFE
ncbi:MAG: DUF1257 domain-containing protein [Desulfobacterales bacterium]|nr:DUF1257 domain-containing protein [Desulfobacterales bacterium]MBF0397788.1 DUF1257 domain-containing protein [Desulfobacterales bacterium]